MPNVPAELTLKTCPPDATYDAQAEHWLRCRLIHHLRQAQAHGAEYRQHVLYCRTHDMPHAQRFAEQLAKVLDDQAAAWTRELNAARERASVNAFGDSTPIVDGKLVLPKRDPFLVLEDHIGPTALTVNAAGEFVPVSIGYAELAPQSDDLPAGDELEHLAAAQHALAAYMIELSEEAYTAYWISGLEFALWEVVLGERTSYGQALAATLGHAREKLKELADACGGWIVWHMDTDRPEWRPLDTWENAFRASRELVRR